MGVAARVQTYLQVKLCDKCIRTALALHGPAVCLNVDDIAHGDLLFLDGFVDRGIELLVGSGHAVVSVEGQIIDS